MVSHAFIAEVYRRMSLRHATDAPPPNCNEAQKDGPVRAAANQYAPYPSETGEDRRAAKLIIAGAILSCVFQLVWFASKCFNQIDFDGMAYTGIAHHLHRGEFHAAINAFRSPLISWLIAAVSFGSADYLHIGKFVSIVSFLLCPVLLYALAASLWHSRLVASLAAFLFTFGRGLSVEAISSVTPDFLFAALVLVYFIVLLRCVRNDHLQDWFSLGVVHGLAFLAKAFALPWLAVCTLAALGLSPRSWRVKSARLGVAALIPLLVAAGWAAVLHSKYGVYTTGTQFKTNLLQWTLRAHPEPEKTAYALLEDTSKDLDEYTVDDPMPPQSWQWAYHVSLKQAFPKMMIAEERNTPVALKELTIVVTPGVVIAFILMIGILTSKKDLYSVEWRVALVIALGAASLVLAYAMLAIDGRYLFPLVPLVLAIATRFLIADPSLNHNQWRKISVALVVLGIVASLVYRSSPYRVLTRDFRLAGSQAGLILKRQAAPSSTLVSIGSGPFPEHGLGWEAGYQAAYFSGDRLIGTMLSLPSTTELSTLLADLTKASPDAIVMWGKPGDARYAALQRSLTSQYPHRPVEKITDPVLGEVGVVIFAR
jgi:Dolichyl-phosphate-mannose-protein mannosyltransferase